MTNHVQVIYALPEQQVSIELSHHAELTVSEAIQQSGILQQFPELQLERLTVGIYSQKVSLQSLVAVGDRIEIYRPLTADPKQNRRERAKTKKT